MTPNVCRIQVAGFEPAISQPWSNSATRPLDRPPFDATDFFISISNERNNFRPINKFDQDDEEVKLIAFFRDAVVVVVVVAAADRATISNDVDDVDIDSMTSFEPVLTQILPLQQTVKVCRAVR